MLVKARPHPVEFWLPLLRRGVVVRATVNVSAMDFLVNAARFDPEYIRERIGSVFLDGRPVDDLNRAAITEGCHLALGMAAPGLAGASLNRGSPLAEFRADISYRPGQGPMQPVPGTLTLKLFNLVARETAASILRLGFAVPGEALDSVRAGDPQGFAACVSGIERGGREIAPARFAGAFADAPVRVALA
ncbi:MAG: hypothetical protein HQK81_03670 [Desulfovibrionaceae bacterium]|nr:hypothetical protein [Desulfovibrionaceae bacterium]MBF0513141.1 hypothetical protein [Desulfovibrionaceae bacterium]